MWVEAKRKVTVKRENGEETTEKMDVLVMGPMIVHVHNRNFRLVHSPSGMTVVDTLTKEDAQRIGEVFRSKCLTAMRETDKEKMLARIPFEVGQWIHECGKKGKMVPPPFQVETGEEEP